MTFPDGSIAVVEGEINELKEIIRDTRKNVSSENISSPVENKNYTALNSRKDNRGSNNERSWTPREILLIADLLQKYELTSRGSADKIFSEYSSKAWTTKRSVAGVYSKAARMNRFLKKGKLGVSMKRTVKILNLYGFKGVGNVKRGRGRANTKWSDNEVLAVAKIIHTFKGEKGKLSVGARKVVSPQHSKGSVYQMVSSIRQFMLGNKEAARISKQYKDLIDKSGLTLREKAAIEA